MNPLRTHHKHVVCKWDASPQTPQLLYAVAQALGLQMGGGGGGGGLRGAKLALTSKRNR